MTPGALMASLSNHQGRLSPPGSALAPVVAPETRLAPSRRPGNAEGVIRGLAIAGALLSGAVSGGEFS